MLRTVLIVSVLFVASTSFAAAESCDAGNGCSVDCDDGCSAVYYQDTKQCVAVCYDKSKKANNRIATPIPATFKNAAKADIERLLQLNTKPARPKKR